MQVSRVFHESIGILSRKIKGCFEGVFEGSSKDKEVLELFR